MRERKCNRHRGWAVFAHRVLVFLALLGPTASALRAGLIRWGGSGPDDLWSDASNWQGGTIPANGDDVVSGGNPAHLTSTINLRLTLNSLTFADDSQPFSLHVSGAGSNLLAFSGLGIQSLTGGTGPIRQEFFADAGATGGTILFSGSSGVNLGTNPSYRPVDLTARGGVAAGDTGGSIIFADSSSTGTTTFTALRAEGASVAGAGAGSILFRGSAVATGTATSTVTGGLATGAAGGTVTFQDNTQAGGNVNVQAGSNAGGQGGRAYFRNSAFASTGLYNDGAMTAETGAEAVSQFFDNSRLTGGAVNNPSGGNGFNGGRLEFHNNSSFTSVGLGPGAGTIAIYNYGSAFAGGGGGRTVFYDDSFVAGTQSIIDNATDGEAMAPGSVGGSTEFHDRSNAGQVQIYNGGANAAGAGTLGGRTLFFDTASAGSATIENLGGYGAGAPGGQTIFAGNSTAGSATILADAGNPLATPGGGGQIIFLDNANGGTATIGLDGNGTLDISSSARSVVNIGSLIGTSGIVNLGSRTLAVGGDNTSHDFYGTIQGTGDFIKEGAGDLIYGGTGTYTGSTSVNAGRLGLFNGTLASPVITVASGATFGGVGTASGRVDLAAGATLSAGFVNGPSALNLGGLTSVAGSQFNFLLGAPDVIGGPKNDLLNVSGNLTLAGTLNVSDSGGFGVGSYRLINYGGTLTNNGLTLGAFPAGFLTSDFTIQTSVAGQVNLVVGGANVLFWDGAHNTPNGVVDGGTSTWNNSTTNWTNVSGTTNVAWANRFSVFSGTAGTVTVTEPVTSTGMQFSTNGYTLNASGTGAITLSGAATIRTDPGTLTTINAPLVGNGSLAKLDTGELTLGGNSTYTGGTTIQDGLVVVTNAAGQGFGSGPVTLFATASAELDFVGNASAGGVTLTNLGGPSTTVSALAVFRDTATAGSATINNRGNTANGGFGGEVLFVNSSSAGTASINNGGSAFAPPAGVLGNLGAGSTSFRDSATAGSATFVNGPSLTSAGIGGRIFFSDNSTAGASAITNQGAFAYGNGGLTEFSGNATAGTATFFNQAATIALSNGGTVNFRDSSSAGSATFTQTGSGVASAGTSLAGGAVTFYNTSSAANGTFFNQGAAASNTYGGGTFFRDTSTAGAAVITNESGSASGGAGGGHLIFSDNATAGNAVVNSEGGSSSAPDGGYVSFIASATAGSATLSAGGGIAAGATGGAVRFLDNSTAANATLTADSGTGGGGAGLLVFGQNSTGGTARVVLSGGTLDISGLTTTGTTVGSLEGDGGNVFLANKGLTVGGNNLSTVFGGSIGGGGTLTKTGTGFLTLTGASTYSGGTVIGDGALIVTNPAGLALGTGLVTNNPSATSGLRFTGSGSAGSVTISNLGSPNPAQAVTTFSGTATAGTANITNLASTASGSTATGGTGGETLFTDGATAGHATITNATGTFFTQGVTGFGFTSFQGNSNAGSATIVNAGGVPQSSIFFVGGTGGHTIFGTNASAATSTIINRGAQSGGMVGAVNLVVAGGQTEFLGNSTAGSSTIFAEGGAVSGALGGGILFGGNSTAGNATLYAESVLVGAQGGTLYFQDNASGGTARAVIQGGTLLSPGEMDITNLNTSGMTIGSVEGGGIVTLGSKNLQVGGNGRGTIFSGLIRDGSGPDTGGSLAVAGPDASLRLTGANTYTGGTSIGDGVNANSGKLVAANTTGSATGTGPVVVNRGGTLSGSGFIAGPVTLHAGGTIAPGDPTTLTLQNNLVWDEGGTIRLVLGADQAHSDLLSIEGTLVRGTMLGGGWVFDLVDAGITPGQVYELVQSNNLEGFSTGDFTAVGLTGDFSFQDGTLDFTVMGVPEPGVRWWLLGGTLMLIISANDQRLRRTSKSDLGGPA